MTEERFSALEGAQRAHSEILVRIERRLFGNGQPGELTKLDARVSILETWKAWSTGICAAVGTIAGALGTAAGYALSLLVKH